MKLLVQSPIFVSFLITFLIGKEERFGASIFGPIFEIIKDQSRVDFYNKIALKSLKSHHKEHFEKESFHYKILSTSESYCDFEYYVKVDVLFNRTRYPGISLKYAFVSYTGGKTMHGASFPLFIRSGKAESERYGKIALDRAKKTHGMEFENPRTMVVEADTKYGYKIYGVTIHTRSIFDEQKEVFREGFFMLPNGISWPYRPYVTKKIREWCLFDPEVF